MQNTKSRTRSYLNLFIPSGVGVVLYLFFSGLLLASSRFSQVQHYLNFPSQLQVERTVTAWLERVLLSTIGQGRTETFVVGFFWAIVGLFVYIFLRGLARMLYEVGEDVEERSFIWPKGGNRYKPLENFMQRSLFRMAAFIALLFYLLHPFSAVLNGPIWRTFLGDNKIVQYVVWYLVTVLVLHGLIILLRLLMLRERMRG